MRQAFNQFFFDRQVPYGLALTRIALPLVTLICLGRRWQMAREIYSSDGAPAPLADNFGYYDFIPLMNGPLAVACFTLLLILLFTLMIGWKTRISAWGVFVLFTYFTLQDSLSTMTKYSVLSSHAFFLLALSRCDAVWSIDRWQKMKAQGTHTALRFWGPGELVEIWPQRLLQLFIGVVYFGAAITKMHTPTYFSGDQFRLWLLTNVNHYNPIGEVMSLFPAMLIGFSYIAIVWEVLFVFLVWNRAWRLPMLGLGIVFHTMTTITLGLVIFPLVCFSIYCSFLTAEDVAWWQQVGQRAGNRFPVLKRITRFPQTVSQLVIRYCGSFQTVPTIGGIVALVALAVSVEHLQDRYGARRSEGRYQLVRLTPEEAARYLNTHPNVREQDKLLSLDIGSWMVGGLVIEATRTFAQGDCFYVQANLIPPHGDMYVQCHLHDADDHVISQTDGIVTRDSFRYTFPYSVPAGLVPGTYQVVLKSNLKEIARKTITITGATVEEVAAN